MFDQFLAEAETLRSRKVRTLTGPVVVLYNQTSPVRVVNDPVYGRRLIRSRTSSIGEDAKYAFGLTFDGLKVNVWAGWLHPHKWEPQHFIGLLPPELAAEKLAQFSIVLPEEWK